LVQFAKIKKSEGNTPFGLDGFFTGFGEVGKESGEFRCLWHLSQVRGVDILYKLRQLTGYGVQANLQLVT